MKILLILLCQGEVGPPGKAGFEGGLGPVGSIGPRGITVQGKIVSPSLTFSLLECDL